MAEVPDTADDAINLLGDDPSLDEVLEITLPFSAHEVGAAGVRRALGGIGGSLTDGSVSTNKLADGSVTTAKLAAGAVTAAKVAADVATQAELDAAIAAAAYRLVYDTAGVVDAGPVLQAAYDAGHRTIVIPPGLFYCNTPVFFDAEDGMASTRLVCDGATFLPGSGLPTVAEWETFNTNRSLPTGTKVLFFPSTYRAGLSGGVVTTVGHNVLGTATHGATKSGIHPHLIIDGGALNAIDVAGYNAALVHTNTGGAVELRSVHMDSARALVLTGSQYVDGNKMYNCSAWAGAGDATTDMACFYQYGSGDGVEIRGVKTAGYILTAKMFSCNSAHISSCVGGGFYFSQCHGIVIDTPHIETANNITNAPRTIYYISDSHVTIRGGFDYLSNTATDGAIVLDDSGNEGKHSTVVLQNYFARRFLDPNTSDPVCGMAIYLNKMNDRSRIDVYSSWCQVSASDATFGQSYGIMGLPVGANAANESTAAAGVATGRDYIGSGTFSIYKSQTSTMSTGQNVAMNVTVGQPGNVGRLYVSKVHVLPTSFDNEAYGATGTLTNGQAYAYAFAICNTLPDGTIQYGAATAERLLTAGAKRVLITELYMPTAAGAGATLVMWRKTGTGVLATPDSYIVLPVGHGGATRLFDTGVNINGTPWLTTSVPVPNTVAAVNHTLDGLYLGTTAVTVP